MNDYTPLKVCSKCKLEKPATTEYFHRNKQAKDGLNTRCKICRYEHAKMNKDATAEYKRDYRRKNNDMLIEKQRAYRRENPDKILEQSRTYQQQTHRDKYREYQRGYHRANKSKAAGYSRKYRNVNSEKIRVYNLRRRARKRNLPDTFTVEQWQACLEYHHYCCAVCGCQLRDLFGNVEPHADHWIPLANSECLGTTPDNIVCLCSECNHSKNAKMPDVWLIEQYGTRKTNEILARIEAYFEWVSKRE